ncbi:hypothetical protein FHT29_000323 [Rhizobium sp. SG741]|nr:hypothetical protein [Rhizobium sp. SG741]
MIRRENEGRLNHATKKPGKTGLFQNNKSRSD